MSFIVIKPNTMRFEPEYLGDKVRVKFPKTNKSQQMIMHIGNEVAKRYGYSKGDRVVLLVDEDNPFIWQIRKDKEGYKLGIQGKHLKLQTAWGKRDKPANWNNFKFVNIEQRDGNMQINFPSAREVDKD
jgi:hypothetical protein